MLTTKQKELLMFIHERLKESGVPPSFDEMKEALDLKSKSGIHRLITALEESIDDMGTNEPRRARYENPHPWARSISLYAVRQCRHRWVIKVEWYTVGVD